jgi:hypothetical protein
MEDTASAWLVRYGDPQDITGPGIADSDLPAPGELRCTRIRPRTTSAAFGSGHAW